MIQKILPVNFVCRELIRYDFPLLSTKVNSSFSNHEEQRQNGLLNCNIVQRDSYGS